MDVQVAARDGGGKSAESNRSGVIQSLPDLHSISAQAAFFASTDGLLLGRVGAYVPQDTSVGNILTHATLSGALALHTSAGLLLLSSSFRTNSRSRIPAIISYLASFALVKYNRISVPISEGVPASSPTPNPRPGREPTTTTFGGSVKVSQSGPPIGLQSLRRRPITGTSEQMVSIERVYLRNFFRTRPTTPPTFYGASSATEPVSTPELQDAYSMLLRCNTVCVLLTFVGLLLAIIGIMAYVWTTFTLTAGIFVSVCFIMSLVGACYALH